MNPDVRLKKMKILTLLLWISYAVTLGAEQILGDPGDYLPLLDTPTDQHSTFLHKEIEEIKASKISSPAAAKVAALQAADDAMAYMRDARSMVRTKSIRRVGRDIPNFAKQSDFVWFVHAEMLGELLQVFCVNANTGEVILLFPENQTK